MSDEAAAVGALEQLGLTEYEAKCFVALTRVVSGTAKEISQLADVPRSRVYDTVGRLHQKGLVDVQQSDPREFRAVSKDEAIAKLREDFDENVEAADTALERLESAETAEETGMWSISSAAHVTDRVLALVEDVDDDVHLVVADESVLEDELLELLGTVSDRGVEILAEVPTEKAEARVEEAVPDAHVAVSAGLRENQDVHETWPGQLVLVDQQAVLASGIQESHLPDVEQETAVWSHGIDHGFAAWIRELLLDRTRHVRDSD